MTLLFHVGLFFFFRNLPPLEAASVRVRKPEPIRLTFAKPAPEASANDQPQMFSELPPDRADKAPEKPQFLSNVTSRARDRTPGGNSDLPHMQGDADVPQVKLESGKPSTPAPAQPSPQAGNDRTPSNGTPTIAASGTGAPAPRQSGAPLVPLSNDQAFKPGAGGADTDQPEMSNPTGTVALLGDVSLNTVAWDYAPWLMRFRDRLLQRWYAPSAYLYGILKEGGWGMFEVEISKSGKILRIDKLEEQGHPSLIQAAQSALRTTNPTEPLPADFPEPTLILRIRMIYPKIRPR